MIIYFLQKIEKNTNYVCKTIKVSNKMNPLLIEDIFIQICHQINQIKTIIMIEEVSKWNKKIIIKNKWFSLPVYIKNDINLICVLKTHNFNNLNLEWAKVTAESESKLGNVHTLNLGCTKVTDESVIKLVNVHVLTLLNTATTNECIKKLRYKGCIIHK